MIPWTLLWQAVGRIVSVLPWWAIACILSTTAGAWGGYKWAAGQAQDDRTEAVQRAIEQANEIARQDEELLYDSVKTRIEIQTRYRTIFRDVPGVRVTDCRDLGADYVRLLNDATRAADPAYKTH